MAIKLVFLGINGDNNDPVSIEQGGTDTHRVHPSHINVGYLLCSVRDENNKEFSVFFDAKAAPTLTVGATYNIEPINALARIPGRASLPLTDHVLTYQELEKSADTETIPVAKHPIPV